MTGSLAGTGPLIRFILRRDRIRIPVWVGAITMFCLSSVAALPGLYPTAESRQARAELMENPSAKIFTGPGHGLDDYTLGAMTANEMFAFTALAVALMNVLLVVRHTRAEEETGRAELIRAAVVGRQAGTAATLIVAAGVNLVLGGLLAVGLPASLGELSMTGSLLFGAGMAGVGLVFAAVAAVAAQLTAYGRGAVGLATAALGGLYGLRVVGDIGDGTLSWLSPFGWAQATRMYVDDRWWPLLPAVALTAALTVLAFALNARRDVGAALLAPRPGRAAAAPTLAGPLGLAWRLQRATVLAWAIGVFLLGVVYGTLIGEIESFVADNAAVRDFLPETATGDAVDAFFAMVLTLVALLVAGFAIQSALRLRTEENAGRVEPVLAAAVPRWHWFASHLTIAALGGTALLVLAGLGLGASGAVSGGDAELLPRLFAAAVVHAPALWLMVGLVAAGFGLAPRLAPVIWAVLAYAVTVGMLGGLLNLPGWAYDLSPLGHTPRLPAEDFAAGPLLALAGLAAALVAVGLVAFRRRDAGAA
ncbi:ABC transporter permease [Solwaraspora sp. WMMD1047]|uniref:ABC transporter permease n=1 Tax=Solwaraspora sp. WMMD1047 TaxID=3016102 RepID=UPI002417C460|nr:ABC transporter permease [Solwaraspora sp. WMMD1047]MDG4830238.1 ABC transporter permease [Solwaraspora sp. WMMD1047]